MFCIVHQNYVGSDVDKFPFFLSVVLTDANHQCVPQYRAILWRKTVIIFNLILLFIVVVVIIIVNIFEKNV